MIRMFSINSRKRTPIPFWMVGEKEIFGIKHYVSHDGKFYKASLVMPSEKLAYRAISQKRKQQKKEQR